MGEELQFNASRSAVELALVDCVLKNQRQSLSSVLPPCVERVTYSGVLASGDIKTTVRHSHILKKAGIQEVKIKVNTKNDLKRISAARSIFGPEVSIRLDANGAFKVHEAVKFIRSVEKYDIACVEQPIERGNVKDLLFVTANSSVPTMADESILTFDDAKELIKFQACDYFNLRISKCGGLYNTLSLAGFALDNGVKIQLGCHPGETAVLSLAGRHLAGFIPEIEFLEGSYGTLLLKEDISHQNYGFGHGGHARLPEGHGLGVDISDKLLEKYSQHFEILD